MSGPHTTDRGAKISPTLPVGAVAVLTAGVDWLTCTSSEPARAEVLQSIGWSIVYAEAEKGNDLRPWSWKGYDGISAGGASVGVRADGCICRLSSDAAASSWRHPVELSSHVSRLDLAVTVRLPPEMNPAADAWARTERVERKGSGRTIRKAAHIETRTEGETCYLGSRSSDRMGRIYNKGLESGEAKYNDCWRWEVEYKGRASTPLASALASYPAEMEAILAHVWHDFSQWGASPIWGRDSVVFPFLAPRQQTDDQRRLSWLAIQVAPVIRRLIARGRKMEAIRALGLDGDMK